MDSIKKYSKSNRFLSIILVLFFAVACSDSTLDDIDTNPELVEDPTLTTLLPQIILSYSQEVAGGNGATFAGYMSEGITYGLGNNAYDAFALFNGEAWENGFLLLNDLNLMKDKAEADQAYAYAGISDIIRAFTLTNLIDLYGDIPFSEAARLDIRAPNFDAHEELYDDIQAILDDAIANLERTDGVGGPGVDDIIFEGDRTLWVKTAYGLKARLYMKLINVDAANAQRSINALNNSFQNEEEGLVISIYANTVQNGNPLAVPEFTQPRSAAGNGIFNAMSGFTPNNEVDEDPRAALWLTIPDDGIGERTPGPNGQASEDFQNPNGDLYSKPRFLQFLQAPLPLLTYTELQFIKAEAELRSGSDDAYATYQGAVRSALEQAALFNPAEMLSQAEIDTYLAYADVSPGSGALTLDDIVLQKFIYLFQFQFIEAYNETRKTEFFSPTNPRGRANQMTYPDSEIDRNPNTPVDQINVSSVFQSATKLVWAD
ncbi:MAG: SusD/RagB family nutrient-binding outer membrane lipoprotein [Bacteroidota bacterium]